MDNIIELTDGFFDLRINDFLPKFRNTHKKEYELIRETKSLFDKAKCKFIGQTVTEDELYLATEIVGLSKLFQSAVVLFERGLLESGNIIIRSCIELSLKIVELAKNKNFIDDMKKEQNFENKRTLDNITRKELYDLVPKEKVEELLSSFNLEEDKPKFSVFKLAEKNNLMQVYILFRLYCNESHQSISTLKEIQVFKDDGVSLNGNLRLDKFSEAIYMLISIVIIPFPALIDKYSTDYELKEQYESLIENLQNTFEKDNP